MELPQWPIYNKDMADHTMLVLENLRFLCEQLKDIISVPTLPSVSWGNQDLGKSGYPSRTGPWSRQRTRNRAGNKGYPEGKPRAMRREVAGRGPAELRGVLITASKWVGQQG